MIVLTMNEDGASVLKVRAGARGYLLKGSGQDEIVTAVRIVAAGGVVLDGPAGEVVLRSAAKAPAGPTESLGLTAREADVLRLLAGGLMNAVIAERLGLSAKTVRNQVSTVLGKLGVASRAEAAARAGPAALDWSGATRPRSGRRAP